MRKWIGVLVVATPVALALATRATSQVQQFDKDELRSAISVGDAGTAAPGPSSPTGTGRPPRVGPNGRANDAQVAAALFGRSETSIAAGGNGLHLVAGWNDAQGFLHPLFGGPGGPAGLSGFAFSSDGSLSWTDGGVPPNFGNIFTRGDPWLDVGGANADTYYYANLAVHLNTGDSLGVSVHRGRFTGNSFAWFDAQSFDSPANTTAPGADFYDKEALVAAKDGSKAVYVSVTNFQELCGNPQFGFGQIEVWRSHDGGDTFQGPAVAGPEAADSVAACGFSGTLQQSSVPAIGPDGEVYVVWQFGPTFSPTGAASAGAAIVVARSLDGGSTFAPPVTVASINSMRQNPPVGYNRSRINDHPRIDVATSGSNRGRVYISFYSAVSPVGTTSGIPCPAGTPAPFNTLCIAQSLVSSQVYVTHSDDQGLTWSTPVPAAPAPPGTGVKRFWPVVTVEPGGNVDVIYYESQEVQATSSPTDVECRPRVQGGSRQRRAGFVSSLVNTFWAQSKDGGATFVSPVLVSTATSNWCTAVSNIRPNFGDYIGSAAGGNRVFPFWADGRNGVPDAFSANILGAGKSN